jgi:hypothetical protein
LGEFGISTGGSTVFGCNLPGYDGCNDIGQVVRAVIEFLRDRKEYEENDSNGEKR